MKTIELTQGQAALVDDEDYEWLSQWKWHADYKPSIKGFYAVRRARKADVDKSSIQMHRALLEHHGIDVTGLDVDHKNHNTLDNRSENIHAVTRRANGWNRKDQSELGVGVKRFGDGYQARAQVNGKYHHIGTFATPEDAANAVRDTVMV